MKRWSLDTVADGLGIGMLCCPGSTAEQAGRRNPARAAEQAAAPAAGQPRAIAKLEITISDLDGPGLAIAAGNDVLAAGCERGTILVWKKDAIEAARKGPVKPQVLKAHQGPVVALAWNGGPILASAGADKKLIFWKMPEGKPQQTATLESLPRPWRCRPTARLLASAGEDVSVQLWDVAAAKPTAKLKDHADWVVCLAFSGDGKQLASGARRAAC